jgi:uncharacterized protein (TIGR02231 family)
MPEITELATQLDAVTVFPDRARLTRRGRTALQPGEHRLEISGLPMSLFPDSLRASGRGTARARLQGVSARIENYVETPAEAARELETKIQSIEDADADLAVQAAVLEKEQQAIDGLASQSEVFARGLALRNRTTADQGAVYDFVTGRGRTLQTELLALGRKRRDLARELDRLRRELQQLQAARPRQRTVAVVEVEVTAAGELEIELSYVVQPARWQPLFDLRLAEAGLEVTYLAEVSQGTGEDWNGVALTLSTARPALSLVIPELEPWYIGPQPPPSAPIALGGAPMAMRASAPMQAAAPAFAEMMEEEAAMPELDLEVTSATVSESGAALTYQIPGRADVPGHGAARKVTIASFQLRPELDVVTAPRLEPVGYRRAKVRNESPYTFLPGKAQLFEGEEYLGATQIGFTAPGQELELALGADERLRVERKLVTREVDKAFLADRRRIRFGYTIEVENLRDAPQVIFVRDQLPVSRHEQIKVKLDAAEPRPSKQTELNQLEWKLKLEKGARQTIRFDFSVEHPRAMVVVGL